MTEFEHNLILMMKCLNKRLTEIVEQLRMINGLPIDEESKDGEDK